MTSQSATELRSMVERWLSRLEAALAGGSPELLGPLFADDAHWRDVVALTWDIGSWSGTGEVVEHLAASAAATRPRQLRLAADHTPPRRIARLGREAIEAYFEFTTDDGLGMGLVRLDDSGDEVRAWILLTTLQGLHGAPDLEPKHRDEGRGYRPAFKGQTWPEYRRSVTSFTDRDPEVLVVGGGHCGSILAARLGILGVDTLVVDRLARPGDSWRVRYESLALHNPTEVVQFPYMPYPATLPTYLPKDVVADWLESFIKAMNVNLWSSTEFEAATYSESAGRWTVTLRDLLDGTQRTLHPRHVVMAIGGGFSGTPYRPQLPTIERFGGDVLHSEDYGSTGETYRGRRVLIVGVATAAHDLAADLVAKGAHVTMVQRSPTTVIGLDTANVMFGHYTDGTPLPECDLIGAANFIAPVLLPALRTLTTTLVERDHDLLSGLERIGMRLDQGEDDTGYFMKAMRYGGRYYINVGASELLLNETVRLIQSDDIDTFVPTGVRLVGGEQLDVDAVILATGYQNQQEDVRRMFGDDIADRVGLVSGLDDRGEVRNGWVPTAQQGLWFMLGGFAPARVYSVPLALQLKAAVDGRLPSCPRQSPIVATAS